MKNFCKKEKLVMILILIAFAVGILIVFFIIKEQPTSGNMNSEINKEEKSYELAKEYISKNEYINALNELKNIQEYKDSSDLIDEVYYMLGQESYNKGDITNAIAYFNKAENYKDSQDYISKCNTIKKLIGSYRSNNEYIFINYEGIIYITMDNGFTEQYTYKIDFNTNTINVNEKKYQIIFKEDASSLYYNNKNYNKESNFIDESKIKFYAPKLGMTQEEVLNTSWGEPKSIDNGGTWADKDNKKRTDGKWDEAWYYKRNDNIIFIEFKNNKVVNFVVSFKGEISSKNLTNVDNL